MQDLVFDERDLRLLHALQVRPRAPWATLAPTVGADPVTLARRWEQLQEQGLAWVGCYPGAGTGAVTAFLEIECAPASMSPVAEVLANDPEVLTIDLTAGGRDMIVTLVCTDDAALSRYVLDRLSTVDGIRSMRTHRAIQVVADAQVWRLRSLSVGEVRALERAIPAPKEVMRQVPADIEEGLAGILRRDARASVTSISGELGISQARVRSALNTVLAQQRVVIRLEVARPYSGWPVYVWFFMRVPATQVGSVAGKLVGLDEVRLVTTTVGNYSLVVAVWLRRIEDITLLERHLGERLPFAEIVDRSIVLRTPKHLGIRLDASGRRIVR
ncbi:Lrp/AsnC family transcriptional regulator [Arthrobacter sp. CJ23]|uniref:Lrp/AsnC family transcriptional regulator n=1 Tax=Arthrobacter sp. CJ23 TaxID=2972479 RepID=UPI00215BE881|nr:Lrp/AsnC family transcriptional regulator [Arthrobacter sp. CJ23]UVJ39877.1 Lrp/AsnC family transcriptional regulator [Arthrobacter sp. CJ23]